MPTVEIDELEFQQNKTLRDTVSKMMANPKAKRKLLEAEKILFPDKKIPEIDEPNPTEVALETQRKEFEEYKKAQADKESKREQEDKIRSLKAQKDDGLATLRREGWMKEALEEVEKIMDEKGILDPLDAAAIYEKKHPPSEPVMPGGSGSWGFLESSATDQDEFTKKLLETKGDDMGLLAAREAQKTLGEIRQQRARR